MTGSVISTTHLTGGLATWLGRGVLAAYLVALAAAGGLVPPMRLRRRGLSTRRTKRSAAGSALGPETPALQSALQP